ncbi:MAG: beta-galactosidase, partial [Verrucomicrobiota bacterium]
MAFDWPDARWWDVGQPNLYSLRLTVDGPGLKDVFLVPRFGFREFWIEGKKLFLNNTEIHLRPTDFEGKADQAFAFGYNYGEAASASSISGDFARRGTDYQVGPWVESADRTGFLLGLSAGQWSEVVANWNDPAKRAEWEQITAREIRRVRNFPSVVSWTHSFNGFQWPGDGDPRFLGKKDFVAIQEYEINHHRINEALAFVKSLNGGQPVYAHFGTYNGDIYTSNLYLNFLPLQEREEWLSHWAREGDMPWMACEFGLPLYCNSMRGRDGYGLQGMSEPLNTEWMASFLGRESYTLEQPAYRQMIRDRYKGVDLQKEYDPHIRWNKKDELIWKSPAFDRVLTEFITKTFRSWRTMGMTAGVVPWHSKWHPAIQAANGPVLAWIAGAGELPGETAAGEAFTSKDHSYAAGATVEKQAVLINDTRAGQPYTLKWEAEVGGKSVGHGETTGRLAVSEILKSPITFAVPTHLSGVKMDACIRLTATMGERVQQDTFDFRVFAPQSKNKGTVAVFDPEGRTTAMLRELGYTVTPWTNGAPRQSLAVVGRKALSSGHQLPTGWQTFVKNGGRLLIEGQDPYWIKYALDLRTAPYVSRQVFRIETNHPVVAGLDEFDLRDWRGHGTLVESHPSYEGFNWTPKYGWHWGNRGSVTSATIEKPHRTSWRPILENEFDLAYTPLMEMEAGRGRIVFCTLDLEDGALKDPAAQKLAAQAVEYARTAPIQPKADTVLYLGGSEGAALLDFLGVHYQPATSPNSAAGLVIVGPGATVVSAALENYAAAGGRVLFLPRADALGWGKVKTVQRAGFKGSLQPPDWPEAAGLSASDLRWRNEANAWLLESGGPAEIGADGLLARRK